MVKNQAFHKKLRGLMIPIAFQNLMLAAVSAGDSAMLGFVNENAMSAVSLASNVQFVENLFLSGVVTGGSIKGDCQIKTISRLKQAEKPLVIDIPSNGCI